MKKLILTIITMLLMHQAFVWAQPPQWSVDASQYEFSMTITGMISLQGLPSHGDGNILAAVVDDQIRGVATPVYDASLDRYLFFLTIFSNQFTGESVTFKYYDTTSEQVIDLWNEVEFVSTSNLGSISDPYIFLTEQPEETSVITFIVEDEQANPIADALLTFDGQSLLPGEYVLENVLPGSYSWQVEKEGFVTRSDQVVIAEGELNVEVHVVMLPADTELFDVHFFVFDIHGNALQEADLMFDGVTYAGQTVITDIEPGAYPYQVIKDGFLPREGQVTINTNDVYLDVILLEEPLDANDISGKDLRLFPNPARELVYLQLPSHSGILAMEFFDVSGTRVLHDNRTNLAEAGADISALNKGVYFVVITLSSGERWVEKLMIQ